ncbi:hypothetical protein V2E39_22765 [Chryseobacterium arthrosphaerae]|uniref:Uncharacterized protein n=1 Tax=Chryseobacterium arthrosphaerae TaxID=651561 RepID=A0ABU7R611_9FLAO
MKNKYIKVSVSDRLPKYGWAVVENEYGEILTVLFNPNTNVKKFKSNYKFFLEEVPNYEDEMKEMLEECRLQLEHLNNPGRGTTNSVLSRLGTLLTKLKTS